MARVVELTRMEVLRVAWRITKEHPLAEDAAQATYLEAFRHAHRFDPTRRVTAWLAGIAANQAHMAMRRHGRFDSLDWPDRISSDQTPENTAAHSDSLEQVRRKVADLPPELRGLIQLRYFNSMTDEGIATTLGQPLGTVKSRMRRAHRILRQQIERGLGMSE